MPNKHALDNYLTQTPEEYYDKKEVDMCECCHCSIYEGEEYYDIDGTILCEHCIHEYLKIAQFEEK